MIEGPDYTADDVIIEDERLLHDGFLTVKEFHLKHKLIEGGWSQSQLRECLIRPPSVVVLPYDPSEDAVVLIEQFRIGAMQQSEGPWHLELIAGLVDPGETAEQAARRESVEEAGVELQDMEFICDYLVSPGGSNEKIFLYCGKIDSCGVGGRFGLESEGEDIWASPYSREDVMHAVDEGYVKNASTIIALQWLTMHYQRLQNKWKV